MEGWSEGRGGAICLVRWRLFSGRRVSSARWGRASRRHTCCCRRGRRGAECVALHAVSFPCKSKPADTQHRSVEDRRRQAQGQREAQISFNEHEISYQTQSISSLGDSKELIKAFVFIKNCCLNFIIKLVFGCKSSAVLYQFGWILDPAAFLQMHFKAELDTWFQEEPDMKMRDKMARARYLGAK